MRKKIFRSDFSSEWSHSRESLAIVEKRYDRKDRKGKRLHAKPRRALDAGWADSSFSRPQPQLFRGDFSPLQFFRSPTQARRVDQWGRRSCCGLRGSPPSPLTRLRGCLAKGAASLLPLLPRVACASALPYRFHLPSLVARLSRSHALTHTYTHTHIHTRTLSLSLSSLFHQLDWHTFRLSSNIRSIHPLCHLYGTVSVFDSHPVLWFVYSLRRLCPRALSPCLLATVYVCMYVCMYAFDSQLMPRLTWRRKFSRARVPTTTLQSSACCTRFLTSTGVARGGATAFPGGSTVLVDDWRDCLVADVF